MDLVAELAALGLGRLVDAFALDVEQPAVIEAAQAAVLDPAVGQVGAAVGTMQADQAQTILVVTKQHQVLAHDADGKGIAARRHLLGRRDGLPIAAQQLAAGRARPGLRQKIVLGLR